MAIQPVQRNLATCTIEQYLPYEGRPIATETLDQSQGGIYMDTYTNSAGFSLVLAW